MHRDLELAHGDRQDPSPLLVSCLFYGEAPSPGTWTVVEEQFQDRALDIERKTGHLQLLVQ